MCNGKCGSGCVFRLIRKILLIVGGLNWGIMGVGMLLGNSADAWNVVHLIFGGWPIVEGIIYVLVGIAAILKLFRCCQCKKCKEACSTCCNSQNPTEQKM